LIAYADSSFIVSLYSADANSALALARVETEQPLLIYSSLASLETSNALNLRVFRNQLSESLRDSILAEIERDIGKRVLIPRVVAEGTFEAAVRLSHKWTPQYGTRSSDLLHVAIALEAGVNSFLSFDKRQLEIARAEGLKF
jgi:predicted nucleic acid-binding protein